MGSKEKSLCAIQFKFMYNYVYYIKLVLRIPGIAPGSKPASGKLTLISSVNLILRRKTKGKSGKTSFWVGSWPVTY